MTPRVAFTCFFKVPINHFRQSRFLSLICEFSKIEISVNVFFRSMEVSKNSTELLGARKIGLLWAERVRKKKKNLAKKEEVDLITEKRRDSFEVPICFSEGRRVSGLEIVDTTSLLLS